MHAVSTQYLPKHLQPNSLSSTPNRLPGLPEHPVAEKVLEIHLFWVVCFVSQSNTHHPFFEEACVGWDGV